jgi:hypothetical protein
MRRPFAPALALLLTVAVAAPAEAASVQRVFAASVGTGGSSGTVKITASTGGQGSVVYALKGLMRNKTYRVEIFKGRCSNLGSIVTRIQSIKAGPSGSFSAARSMSTTAVFNLWEANWTSLLAVRFISGTSVRCGNVVFPHATRVRLPSYGIDLAVVRGPNGYPYCNVAMYMGALSQPTEAGATFIFAHARTGMFLPLLNASKVNNGAAMIGRTVYVYTSNSMVHTYTITTVRRHVKSVQSAVSVTAEQLWLQTSEGPNFTYPKLVIIAKRTASDPTTYSLSHPAAHIVHCA